MLQIYSYFTIQGFANYLQEKLLDYEVVELFTQEKEELIIRFGKNENEYHLIINCNASTQPFYFLTEVFHRSSKNSLNLFREIEGQYVTNIHILQGERILIINLSDGKKLVLKLFGKVSNVLLMDEYNQVLEIFKHSLETDWNLQLNENQGIDYWLQNEHITIEEMLNCRLLDTYLKQQIQKEYEEGSKIQELVGKWYALLSYPQFYLRKKPLNFALFPFEGNEEVYSDVNEALTAFVKYYYKYSLFESRKEEVQAFILSEAKKLQGKIRSQEKSLKQINEQRSYEELGHIIMCHPNLLQKGYDKYVFQDIYNGGDTTIKLKKELTFRENAELYYQKHKKQKIEKEKLLLLYKSNIEHLKMYESHLKDLESIENHKELERWMKDKAYLVQVNKHHQQERVPYKEFIIEGYKIWVGKGAKDNDELTLRYSYKEDVWLHAKDVAGSHVLIKVQKGKAVPQKIIEKAAALAAYYSKNRNQSFVPVIQTLKKYVRKGKGLPPGKVIVEREEVIFVKPMSFEEL